MILKVIYLVWITTNYMYYNIHLYLMWVMESWLVTDSEKQSPECKKVFWNRLLREIMTDWLTHWWITDWRNRTNRRWITTAVIFLVQMKETQHRPIFPSHPPHQTQERHREVSLAKFFTFLQHATLQCFCWAPDFSSDLMEGFYGP